MATCRTTVAGLLWLNEAAPSPRSNIPQTALVATLDTYDLTYLGFFQSGH
jgi:hypothetical protein